MKPEAEQQADQVAILAALITAGRQARCHGYERDREARYCVEFAQTILTVARENAGAFLAPRPRP
jgi:hypothetical protein